MKYSIIIPVYNSAEFVLKPLNSLKNQKYQNLEIIVVNDGSTDNSEEVILDFKKSNPKMNIIYKRNENAGPSSARNTGIELATGDYMCFLDSDDTYNENLFQELEEMIVDEDIIYWGFLSVDEEGKVREGYCYSDFYQYVDNLTGIEAAKKKCTKELWINNCDILYKTSLVKENNLRYLEGVYAGEDANFIYNALFNAKKVRVLPKPYFEWTHRETSLSRVKFNERYLTEFKAIEDNLKYIEDHNIPEVYDYIYSLYYHTRAIIGKKLVKSLKWYQGFKFVKLARRYIPKIKKRKPLIFNKKQKVECGIYRFSKLFFFYFVKFYYATHKYKLAAD